jgi:hypothetical protein
VRGHGALVGIGAVLALVVAAAVVAVLRWPHDPADDTFEVAGRSVDCRATGVVALEVAVFYPGPTTAFVLDGEPLAAQHPGGDPYELRPDRPLRFSCADGETHRVEVVGRRDRPGYDGCRISLVSPLAPIDGKDVRPVPHYDAGEGVCDVSWTD